MAEARKEDAVDFEFDEDQLELQRAAAELLGKECPASFVRAVWSDEQDPRALWDTLVSLDWPGLAIGPEHGGVGATAVELAIVLEQLGHVSDPTPFLATTTQFVPAITAAGDADQQHRFLTAVSAGSTGTLALAGSNGRWDVDAPVVEATRAGNGWTLNGKASFVLDGDRVDEIVVLAGTGDGAEAFVVPTEVVTTRRLPAMDGALHLAEVTFDAVTVPEDRRLATDDATAAIRHALDESLMGVAMVTVGACQRALDMVIDYVKEREQFGVPIGSFQAVKHKAVDMYLAVERAKALGYFAALTIAENDPRRPLAAAMAKAAAGEAQRLVVRHAIQLFGGVGFTWENDLHLYLRRAKAGELILGSAAHHRARVARDALDHRVGATA